MNKIRIDIGEESKLYKFPSSFGEMSGEQLMAAASFIINSDDENVLRILCGIDVDVFSELSGMQRYAIRGMFDFVLRCDTDKLSFGDWKIGSISVGGNAWYGPMSNFANVSWGEFIYVDQCMINGLHKAAVAAMFRQERKDYDFETDIRVPFTTYGTKHRFELLDSLPENIILAIVLNYRAMRNHSLEKRYSEIFPQNNAKQDDENLPDDTPEDDGSVKTKQFSWTEVHRNLIHDCIQDEDKFLNLNVHTVLNRINQNIIYSKKMKH